jgi:hypothetical protein
MVNHPNRPLTRDGRGKMKFEYQDYAGKMHKSAKAANAANAKAIETLQEIKRELRLKEAKARLKAAISRLESH